MCFSLPWLEQLCVWIIMIIALVSIIRIVIPWLESFFGLPGPVTAIINIIIWAIIAIMAVYVIFGLLACLFGGSGIGLLPHH